jgi:purine nucleosidase
MLVDILMASTDKFTIIETGPLSNLALALKLEPRIVHHIERVVWMGGAVNVPGNVYSYMEPTHSGTAEWNVYWDPDSLETVLAHDVKLVIAPLDVTNLVPLSKEFVASLALQRVYPVSDLVGLMYSLVIHFPDYYLWDMITAVYALHPEWFTVRETKLTVVTQGHDAGMTREDPKGRPVILIEQAQVAQVFEHLLKAFQKAV